MDIRHATPADIPALMQLQDTVLRSLPNPDMLQPDSEAFYENIVTMPQAGQILLALDDRAAGETPPGGHTLAGCSVLRFPAVDERHLGHALGLTAASLPTVAHLEAAYFLPQYRGRGLGTILGTRNLHYAGEQGRPLVCATASPANVPSLKNLFALGFHVEAMTEMYGGLQRFILLHNALAPENPGVTQALVPVEDTQGHTAALARKLIGTAVNTEGGCARVRYVSR